MIVGTGLAGLTCAKVMRKRGARDGKKLILNAEDDGFLNDVAEISCIPGRYALPGRSPVNAVAPGVSSLPGKDFYRCGAEEVTNRFSGVDLEPFDICRVSYARLIRPPGVHESFPPNRTGVRGLVLAGEYMEDCSINDALSGKKAAEEALRL